MIAGNDETAPGYVVFARLGKKVLRPGGRVLTTAMLARAGLPGTDVVEIGPGRGRTAREIRRQSPRSYVGVDPDPGAGSMVGSAAETGLPGGSADVVVEEAVLSMQSDRVRRAAVAEVTRLLRPGGRFALHELGLAPDDLAGAERDAVRQAVSRAARVNARPLTVLEWTELLAEHGFDVVWTRTAPMALLRPARLLSDEGFVGATRFVRNVLTHPVARRRVLAMRQVFATHRRHLVGVAIVARKRSQPS
jgi:SAM-dependent methyltransferase